MGVTGPPDWRVKNEEKYEVQIGSVVGVGDGFGCLQGVLGEVEYGW